MPAEPRGRWTSFVAPAPNPPTGEATRSAGVTTAPVDTDQHDSPTDDEPADDRTAGEVATVALGAAVELYLEHEGALERSDDSTHVHQARVATRRLRSHLRVFGDVLDRAWTDDLRAESRWVGRLLGAARDPDVLGERLTGRIERLPASDHVAAETIITRVRARRENAGTELASALSGPRYDAWRSSLVEAARAPRLGSIGGSPARIVLPPIAARLWEELEEYVASLGADPTDEALHRVRIATKRSRYATEAVAPVIGEPARRLAAALRRLQNRLGEHQDAVIAQSWLRGVAVQSPSDVAFVAGELAAIERRAAQDARAAWPRAWRRASDARLH